MAIRNIAALAFTALALAACTHKEAAAPPVAPVAVIPLVPKPVDRTIGTATMLADGTIVMNLRTSMDTGTGRLTQKLKPTDVQYAVVLKQLGGLRPGQSKPMTQYPGQ
jgi:hypothetical protein